MYKLDLPIDIKEKAAIERRRRAEKERQGRIFNARNRQIGVMKISNFDFTLSFLQVDKEALDQQILDRKWMDELEDKRASAFGKFSFLIKPTNERFLLTSKRFDSK